MNFKNAYVKYIDYLSLKLKPTTLLSIKYNFNKHILPFFEDKDIHKINSSDIFTWQNYIKGLGFSDGFNYRIQNILKKFYDYLEKFYDVKNLIVKCGFFKNFAPKEKKQLNVWSISDFKKFIKCVDEPIYHVLFKFMFLTGCRKGETLALRFSDLQGRYISINKTITKELFGKKHLEMSPKSKKSIRKIRIDFKLKHEINSLRKYYIKKYNNFNDNFYIFGYCSQPH